MPTLNQKYDRLLAEMYNDVLLFAFTVLPHHFSLRAGKFHREIFNLLKENHRNNCIIAPRNHSKSTTVTLAYVLHQILYKRRHFIVIISDTYTQSEMFLDAIKKELETNEMIKGLFGNYVGDQWGEGEITTSSGTKIVAKGTGNKIRGLKFREHRPDLVICDDLENEELVENQDRRTKVDNWFSGSVMPSLDDSPDRDEPQLIVIGTILHYDSLLRRLSLNKEFKCLFYRAVMNGKPLWDAKFNLEKLEKIKNFYKEQGKIGVYYCEYMNEPVSNENAIFKQEYFKYYSDNDIYVPALYRVLTVDLAISQKQSSDYTVIVASGTTDKNDIYLLEIARDHYTPIETIDHIFRLAEKWEVQCIGIESVAYQKSLIWFLQAEMKKRNKFFLVKELKADVDKERRIRGLQPRYATGSVYHRNTMTALEEELIMFPKAPHDDIADAVAYIPQIAFEGQATESAFDYKTERRQIEEIIESQEDITDF
jgi:predicted phage terminase large subunit-like protein